MMTPNELHYMIAAMGFGLFFTSGLCAIFHDGWKNSNRWFVLILLYVALTFLSHIPFVDAFCNGSVGVCVLRDVFNVCLAPLMMLMICRFAQLGKGFTVALMATTVLGSAGMIAAFHALIHPVFGHVLFLLTAAMVVMWCLKARKNLFSESGPSDLKANCLKWFSHCSLLVAVLFLGGIALRLYLPFLRVEKLVLIAEAGVSFPLLLYYQYESSDRLFHSNQSQNLLA
ncbi:MAG: hypothetical protein HUK17_02860 [Bacteroidales bacterium]|nr:hypothetical protein [Bacteroidales bacterium]